MWVNMLESGTYLWIVLSGIQIVFTVYFLLTFYKVKKISNIVASSTPCLSFSIIICGHNEAEHISHQLLSVLKQNMTHPDSEVIFVNDRSTDHSNEILQQFQSQFSRLKIIHIPTDKPRKYQGKKDALMHAFEEAKGEYLILLDADCAVTHDLWAEDWINWMSANQVTAGLGIGKYEKGNGLLQQFIQFETLNTFMQYGSYAMSNRAYMGVGRNLVYEKSVIKEAIQDPILIALFQKTIGGDDDLMIHYLKDNDHLILPYFKEEQATISKTSKNWKAYFKQKSRHVSVGKHYSRLTQMLLGAYAFSQALWWVLLSTFIALFIFTDVLSTHRFVTLLITFVVVFNLKYFNYNIWNRFHSKGQNSITFVWMELLWLIYHVILIPFIFWKNNKQWK